MATPGGDIVRFSVAEAAVEPYLVGGLIQRAVSPPEHGMDGFIGGHLGVVAMLNARGDAVPERPMYVFNPDTRLLINYAYRRSSDPARQGFFADVVELDDSGKPRHGVGVVNPFQTETGFVQVSVGDNKHGFAPSHTELRVDGDDPLQSVPPNIETADLLAMLAQEAIDPNESASDYIARRRSERDEFRQKVSKKAARHFLHTTQSLDARTDPDIHLIISDRDNTEPLAAASREVGLYPIVLTTEEVLIWQRRLTQGSISGGQKEADAQLGDLIWSSCADLRDWASTSNPGFVTFDLPETKRFIDDLGRQAEVKISRIQHDIETSEPSVQEYKVKRWLFLHEFVSVVMQRTSIFSQLINDATNANSVRKEGHGSYNLNIDTDDPGVMQNYTDWLRKARLDMALTLYLRGLNQL